MRPREFFYRWEWELQASPEALWPLVADTNRFNYDTGLPAVQPCLGGETRPTNARRLAFSWLGVQVEWEEQPFEWIRPSRFGVVRNYLSGPLAEMRVLAELTPREGGGSRLVYQVSARPKTLLGLVAIPIQIGLLSARRFDTTFRQYDRLAREGKLPLDLPRTARLAPGGGARLASLRERLLAEGARPDLLARLVETIEQGDDLTLARMRPYALADHWQAPRRAVLELCLLATRAGLLDLQWDFLCPLCRGAKQTSHSLRDIQSQVHCDSCQIDFAVNFERLVELTFRPNPAVRPVECYEFCVGGPQVTPHVIAQQLLSPGEGRTLTLPLEEGRYRLRTLQLSGGQFLQAAGDGLPEVTLRASAAGWPAEEVGLGPTPKIHFENATDTEQLFVLERMAWTDQAATAAEVTALQRFRDLFASEVLRPGEQVSVGNMTVVFTDLRDSTRLYREIGDATAFGTVWNHFDVLRKAIAAEEGALVKTIGDAVMAVFRRPAAALRAILHAQQLLATRPNSIRPLVLKAGMHAGPCIAITLNDRLDYFGSTVNIAARLGGLSSGADVVISAAVRADPEVAEMLADPSGALTAEATEATLKGFDAERFQLWRVAKGGKAATPPGA